MEYVTCNLCGSKSTDVLPIRGNNLTSENVSICKKCGLVFLNPRMDESELKDFYTHRFSIEYRDGVLPSYKILSEMEERAKSRYEYLSANAKLPAQANILEIGCATGHFLRLLSVQGYACKGIEPDIGFSNYGKEHFSLNIETDILRYDKLGSKKYDLICLFHVLEHISDPIKALFYINYAIRENGCLFLEVPDLLAALKRNKFDASSYFHKAHLYDFSYNTIKMFLIKTGFSLISTVHDSPFPKDKNLLMLARKTTPLKSNVFIDEKNNDFKVISKYFNKEKNYLPLSNFDSFKRSFWRYPSFYIKLRSLKKAITGAQVSQGVEQRPEFSQLNQILSNPESRHLIRGNGKGPRVLCFNLRGAWTTHTAWETIIALSLRLRGAQVEFFTCGGALPACGMEQIGKPPCISCYHYLLNFVQPFGFPIKVANGIISKGRVQKLYQTVEATSWQNVYNYEYNGLNLGQIVLPMVRWYLRRGSLLEDKETLNIYHTFLKSGVIVHELCQSLLSRNNYDVIFCINGEFFAEAIIHYLAKKRGIRVVTYERGYHPDSLFFQHDAPACKYVVERYWEQIESTPLTAEENHHLDEYLSTRHGGVKGIGGLIFWPKIEQDEVAIRNALGLNTERHIAVLFTNTTFDTMSQNMEVAFRDMFHWIKTTIDYFNIHPEWQLVIRVHPSEVRDTGRETREPVTDWIKERFPDLPDNIKIVPPESELSSYSLMRMSRVGFVYTSLAGLEMALMDKPVIVAGKAHYRGKGFTDDPMSPENYLKILENSLLTERTLSPEQSELARRYAYLFFFRSMIPFDFLREPTRSEVELNFGSLTELMPGRNKALDVICNGILDGKDFLL